MATEKDIREAISQIENVETLRSIFQDVANALRAKGVEKDPIYPNEYAELIGGIDTVAAGTEDATATSSDIAIGKTAYAKGDKVTGKVPTYEAETELSIGSLTPTYNDTNKELSFRKATPNDRLLREGVVETGTIPGSSLGDASTGDVVRGRTFTSKNGLKLSGTASLGIDTSDATATAKDIVKGKTAYGPSGLITGTVAEKTSIGAQVTPQVSSSWLNLYYTVSEDSIIRSGKQINLYSSSSVLGEAATSDVKPGATFTSKNGLKLTGAMQNAGAITGNLGTTSGASWSSSDPNRGSGKVSVTGVNQTAGWTDGFSNGSLSLTVPANRLLKGRTVTPTTTEQTIANAEDIAYGAIKVAGDANLIPANIVSGKSIFGVAGTASVKDTKLYTVYIRKTVTGNSVNVFIGRFSNNYTYIDGYIDALGTSYKPLGTTMLPTFLLIIGDYYIPNKNFRISSIVGASATMYNVKSNLNTSGNLLNLGFLGLFDPVSDIYIDIGELG